MCHNIIRIVYNLPIFPPSALCSKHSTSKGVKITSSSKTSFQLLFLFSQKETASAICLCQAHICTIIIKKSPPVRVATCTVFLYTSWLFSHTAVSHERGISRDNICASWLSGPLSRFSTNLFVEHWTIKKVHACAKRMQKIDCGKWDNSRLSWRKSGVEIEWGVASFGDW